MDWRLSFWLVQIDTNPKHKNLIELQKLCQKGFHRFVHISCITKTNFTCPFSLFCLVRHLQSVPCLCVYSVDVTSRICCPSRFLLHCSEHEHLVQSIENYFLLSFSRKRYLINELLKETYSLKAPKDWNLLPVFPVKLKLCWSNTGRQKRNSLVMSPYSAQKWIETIFTWGHRLLMKEKI